MRVLGGTSRDWLTRARVGKGRAGAVMGHQLERGAACWWRFCAGLWGVGGGWHGAQPRGASCTAGLLAADTVAGIAVDIRSGIGGRRRTVEA